MVGVTLDRISCLNDGKLFFYTCMEMTYHCLRQVMRLSLILGYGILGAKFMQILFKLTERNERFLTKRIYFYSV